MTCWTAIAIVTVEQGLIVSSLQIEPGEPTGLAKVLLRAIKNNPRAALKAQGREDWMKLRRSQQSEKSNENLSSDNDQNDARKNSGVGVDDDVDS
jgi:hypothetical protein